eukprot:CAMPEP_0170793442 /NCGR_PEP_ID=MMETSP0733-20121128/22664_1 /TAXON_ID=186038 /ORGANISM="Fragilariopsis kerguelensis, Strain L26-C5" /LENGTH=108 /DNA_ID=CAMNT_0011142407 /DNA_START=160 /DNA_END=484 /DNA_ORIENTATION=-
MILPNTAIAASTTTAIVETITPIQSASPLPPPLLPPSTIKEGTTTRIVRLSSGVQFSDVRVGSGPTVVVKKKAIGTVDKNTNDDNDSSAFKGIRRDDSILFDTRDEGR